MCVDSHTIMNVYLLYIIRIYYVSQVDTITAISRLVWWRNQGANVILHAVAICTGKGMEPNGDLVEIADIE